jgi:hypothetical protein
MPADDKTKPKSRHTTTVILGHPPTGLASMVFAPRRLPSPPPAEQSKQREVSPRPEEA